MKVRRLVWTCFCSFAFAVTIQVGSPGPLLAQTSEELFQLALSSSGAEYAQVRDRIVEQGDRELLRQKLDSDGASEQLLARILLAWLDEQDWYRELLTAETTTNRALTRNYPWAGRELLDQSAVPLLMEILLKGGSHENARLDATRSLIKMARSGIRLEPRWFTTLLDTGDPEIRRHVASILAELPADQNDLAFDELRERLDSEDDPLTARYLLQGVVSQASTLPAEQKGQLVAALTGDAWRKKLGDQPVYSALAEIGGDEAETVLLEHLRKTLDADDSGPQRQAIEWLLQLRQPAATDALLDLADDAGSPEHVRKWIHAGVANLPHDEKINRYLLQVVRNDRLSADERIEAVRSLGKIRNSHKSASEETRFLQTELKNILDGGVGDPDLRKSLEDFSDDNWRRDNQRER